MTPLQSTYDVYSRTGVHQYPILAKLGIELNNGNVINIDTSSIPTMFIFLEDEFLGNKRSSYLLVDIFTKYQKQYASNCIINPVLETKPHTFFTRLFSKVK